MMAGLAVVVPRLPGLAAIVEREGVGLTFEPRDAADLAAVLERLAADRELLGELRERARQLALERYNAEEQALALAAAWQL
jgi:glycosyltransferase involved in cell wall biosynthesis